MRDIQTLPVLMVTQDLSLWQRWKQIEAEGGWLPARGDSLQDLVRWRQQGRVLVLLDAHLPRLPEWTEDSWVEQLAGLKVLLLSSRLNDELGRQALMRGVAGYAHAYSPVATLARIVQSVADGNIWLGPALLSRLLRDVSRRLPPPNPQWVEQLTPRETEVARRAAIGESNQAIADAMGVTERTVRAHLSAIFVKLEVTDRLMLALKVHGIGRVQQES
jgi:DNA-binding NarL/FixJ family response regulator